MKIHAFLTKNPKGYGYVSWHHDPLRHCEIANIEDLIKEFPKKSSSLESMFLKDFDVLIGAGHISDPWPLSHNSYHELDRKNILLDFECTTGWENWEHQFDKILHIDPYTCDWRNSVLGEEKYQYVYFPINPKHFFEEEEKTTDVMYAGGLGCADMTRDSKIYRYMIEPMRNHNHVLVVPLRKGVPNGMNCALDIEHVEKARLINKTKVTLTHNIYWGVYPGTRRHNSYVCHDGWQDNFAFSEIKKPEGGEGFVPQLKERAFSAAAGRSLIVCKKDPFNIIEKWFTPGKHFIYLDDEKPNDHLTDIIENYDSEYKEIAYRAHDLCRDKYTSIDFYKDFILPFSNSLEQE